MTSEILLLATNGMLGIFLGTQITEAFLFVPYWKAQKPDEFFDLHQKYGKQIYQFFAPLTILATGFPLGTVGWLILHQSQETVLTISLGVSTLLFFSTYYLYFKEANKRFAERSIANEDLPGELVRWGNWHWGRIVFEGIALVVSMLLLAKV